MAYVLPVGIRSSGGGRFPLPPEQSGTSNSSAKERGMEEDEEIDNIGELPDDLCHQV